MQGQSKSSRTQSEQYQLFILRVWEDRPGGPQRFMLKAADDDHRHVFGSAQSLVDFLEKTTFTVKGETR